MKFQNESHFAGYPKANSLIRNLPNTLNAPESFQPTGKEIKARKACILLLFLTGNTPFCLTLYLSLSVVQQPSPQFRHCDREYGDSPYTDITFRVSGNYLSCSSHCRFSMFSMRVGTLIVETIYLQLIQNRYLFRSFTVLQCSHQHCVQPVASDVEVVGYL